jgi:WD40 repeat protein
MIMMNAKEPYEDSFGSQVTLTLSGLGDSVFAVELSPDGKYLALGDDGGNLEVRICAHECI